MLGEKHVSLTSDEKRRSRLLPLTRFTCSRVSCPEKSKRVCLQCLAKKKHKTTHTTRGISTFTRYQVYVLMFWPRLVVGVVRPTHANIAVAFVQSTYIPAWYNSAYYDKQPGVWHASSRPCTHPVRRARCNTQCYFSSRSRNRSSGSSR